MTDDSLGGIGGGNRGLSGGGGMMGNSLMGCELRANAPGFRSDGIDLSNHRALDNPDLGSIVLHRLANVEGTSVSATSLNAPKDAKKAWEKGTQLLHKSKAEDASKELQKAVDIYPKFASAWLELGRARIQQQQFGPANEALLKAVEADSKLVEPYVELGMLASRQQNWPDAAQYLDRALRLDPIDFPQAWFVDAVANYNIKNYENAEKSAREAKARSRASQSSYASIARAGTGRETRLHRRQRRVESIHAVFSGCEGSRSGKGAAGSNRQFSIHKATLTDGGAGTALVPGSCFDKAGFAIVEVAT